MRVYRGSVKNFYVEKEPTQSEFGFGYFEFTDDYSIFDFGKMPDKIEGKGESLAQMSAYNFGELSKLGIRSHFRKFVPPKSIEVDIVRVLYPQKGEVRENETNYLVPLEVIFRNSLPQGSSVFKRLEMGQLKLSDLGLSQMPVPGEKLKSPLVDVSTKLEPTDRYLDWGQAQGLARINDEMLAKIKDWTLKINDYLTKKAEKIGIEHADGKVEFAVSPHGELILVDVCGTLDENRFLFDGVHLSKQVLRDYYKTTPWYEELEKAKSRGLPKDEWPHPSKAPWELLEIVSGMYRSTCESWVGQKIWFERPIAEIVREYREFLKHHKRK